MLELSADGVQVTTALADVPSVSGDEKALTDEVEIALRGCAPLDVERTGNVVSPVPVSAEAAGSSWPDTWTPCRSPTMCRRIVVMGGSTAAGRPT